MSETLPTEVTIEYRVPLFVIVTRNKEIYGDDDLHVHKVVVYDEAELADGKGYDPEGTPLADDDPLVIEARQLIERDRSTEWPAWEFGW